MSDDNFSVYAGDDKILAVTVQDNSGNIVDITDMANIRWWMARTVTRVPLIEKDLILGIEIVNGGSGRFDVTIDAIDTENLRPGDYYHEAEVINDQGLAATVLAGTMTILPTLIKFEVSPSP